MGISKQASKHWFETSRGYCLIYQGKSKSIGAHRLTMQAFLKRKLLPKEHVHHLNEIKQDNRIENLSLISASEHAKLHFSKRMKEMENARKIKKIIIKCDVCGKLYKSNTSRAKWCSYSCKKTGKRLYMKKWSNKKYET